MFIILVCETFLTKDTIFMEALHTITNECDNVIVGTYYRPQTKLREGNVFTPVCDSVHRGVSVQGVSLSRGVSLQWGVSVCRGSLSGGEFLSRGLCPGGFCPRGLSPEGVSVQGGGHLSRGVFSRGVFVQRASLSGDVSVWGGSLSRAVSVQRMGGWVVFSVWGGSLSGRPPHMVKSGRYASYWNAFLSGY